MALPYAFDEHGICIPHDVEDYSGIYEYDKTNWAFKCILCRKTVTEGHLTSEVHRRNVEWHLHHVRPQVASAPPPPPPSADGPPPGRDP